MDADRGDRTAHTPAAVGHARSPALVARSWNEARASNAQRVRDDGVAAAEQAEDGVDPVGNLAVTNAMRAAGGRFFSARHEPGRSAWPTATRG